MGNIKVFLSSSKDLKEDRKDFEIFIGREKTMLAKIGTALDLLNWESSDDRVSVDGLQEGYNSLVESCDVFVLLYSLKVGKYTLQEFERAHLQFKLTGKPDILIYYKEEEVLNTEWSEEDRKSVDDFNGKMSGFKHFPTSYTNADGMCLHFRQQLQNILHPPGPKIKNHNLPGPPHGNILIGRRDSIAQIIQAICTKTHLVTIEGFAGIGKTSVALEIGHILLNNSQIKIQVDIPLNYIVWVSGKDKPDQKLWFNDVLDTIADVLDHSSITQIAADKFLEKRKEIDKLLRSELYNVFLILDNYETIQDVELEKWLSSWPKPNKILITSQTQFPEAYTIDLKSLKENEAKELVLKYAEEKGLNHLKHKAEEQLLSLVRITGCNPLAIKMAVGYIRGGTLTLEHVVEQLATENPTERMDLIFKKLHEASWGGIGENAQKVLLVTPLFVGVNSIDRNALQGTCGLEDTTFENAIETLLKWKLFEVNFDENNRYTAHPITRRFATNKLMERKEFEIEARRRWYKYYITFIKNTIIRKEPDESYWNVLVDERMERIDAEWTSINEVLKWACASLFQEKHSIVLEMVLLLIHYMDSRFYNLERLKYVKYAVEAAMELNRKYEEALLRIDALGWTYVEENRFGEAINEIMIGIEIAKSLIDESGEGSELLALGYSWWARAKMEEGMKIGEAVALLNRARAFEQNSRSWILFRILMASGDIYLKQGQNDIALIHYQQARNKMKDYGGEGNYYQINPRIGLAHLALGELDEAEQIFKDLANQQKISIGKLYGDYGMALIKFKRKNTEDAKMLLKKIKDELSRRTSSNLLLKLIVDFEKSLNVEFNPISLLPDKKNFNSGLYGNKTDLYILRNKNNVHLAITNYGARIVSILVPDKDGHLRDIVIGPESIHQFMTATEHYFGATIGRYANRISNGKFKINEVEHLTGRNENEKTTLHGGFEGFQSVLWDVQHHNETTIKLTYLSPDGMEGFPGNLHVEVVISLTDNNELQFAYTAHSDKRTIVSLTNHAFFNLNGQAGNRINGHLMQINADHYTPIDTDLIPIGKIDPVTGTPFDFREPVSIGSRINEYNIQLNYALGYDHNFVLNKLPGGFDMAAKVLSPESGIQMEVYTTEPCLQFYSGNAMKGNNNLKGAKTDVFRNAFVLETQQFPDSPNQPNFPTAVIEAGQIFASKTLYRFSVLK